MPDVKLPHVTDVQFGRTTRKSYQRLGDVIDMPDLIEVQKKSYQWFLDVGLREVFHDVGAITDYTGNLELRFIDYVLEKPEVFGRGVQEQMPPMRPKVRVTAQQETEEIAEQEIFMGISHYDPERHFYNQRCRTRHKISDSPLLASISSGRRRSRTSTFRRYDYSVQGRLVI